MWFICNSNISDMGNLMVRIHGIPFQSIQQNLAWKLLTILKNILKKIYTHLIWSWNDFFSFFSFRSDQTMKNIQRSIDRIEKIIDWFRGLNFDSNFSSFKFNDWRIRKVFVSTGLALNIRTPCISTCTYRIWFRRIDWIGLCT